MANREPTNVPRISPDDWLSLIVDEVTDPTHHARWQWLAAVEPEFAREVLNRAIIETPNIDERKKLIDNMTWAACVALHGVSRNERQISDGAQPVNAS